MTIAFACPGCRKTLKAKPELAGRTFACPGCRTQVTVPRADAPATRCGQATQGGAATSSAGAKPATPSRPATPPAARPARDDFPLEASALPFEEDDFRVLPPVVQAEAARGLAPAPQRLSTENRRFLKAKQESLAWTKHAHWALVVAFIPLIFSLMFSFGDLSIKQRILNTLAEFVPEDEFDEDDIRERLDSIGMEELHALVSELPDKKLSDALLPRDSSAHWVFAAISATLFMGFLIAMAWDGAARWWQLLLVGAFTGTFGVMLLLGFQLIAAFSQSYIITGFGIFSIFFWIIKLIGLSYTVASDPESSFLGSAVGFTVGVGLCEELCKAIPIMWYFQHDPKLFWRGALLWGMASGVGFGVAEGIMYSSDFYNGIQTTEAYLVRFLSCVALHAVWAGAVAISIYRNYGDMQGQDSWFESFFVLLRFLAVPMILHGFYDTFLMKDYPFFAVVVAGLSFVYFGRQIQLSERYDD